MAEIVDHFHPVEYAVPLDPKSEPKDVSVPDDYRHDHPTEDPKMWGWHGEWGRSSRVAGWVVVAILLLMMTTTHYNLQGSLFLGILAALLAVILISDMVRRRNAWRK